MRGAFLALWNGIGSPAMRPEYEAWHTFEHVPERVGLPGFLEGRRYRATRGNEAGTPDYFTCYDLVSRQVLATGRYAEVVADPTPWSARMRPHLNAFLRLPCELLGQAGVGHGSRIAVLRLRPGHVRELAALGHRLASLVDEGRAVAALWGACVPDAAYPLANSDAGVRPGDVVAILEHLDETTLRSVAHDLAGDVTSCAPSQFYEMLTSVRQADLRGPLGQRQPARPELLAPYLHASTEPQTP